VSWALSTETVVTTSTCDNNHCVWPLSDSISKKFIFKFRLPCDVASCAQLDQEEQWLLLVTVPPACLFFSHPHLWSGVTCCAQPRFLSSTNSRYVRIPHCQVFEIYGGDAATHTATANTAVVVVSRVRISGALVTGAVVHSLCAAGWNGHCRQGGTRSRGNRDS
jgi:hypothetical protein